MGPTRRLMFLLMGNTAFVGIIKTDGLPAVAARINLYQYHQNRILPVIAG